MTTDAPLDESTRADLRRPFVLGVGAALFCALPALALNRWEVSLDEAQRLVPVVLHLRSAALFLPLLPLVTVIAYVARRAWPAVRALPKPRRLAWIAGLAVMQLALLFASAYAHAITQKNWLFSTPLPFASMRSPDGRRTAYATQDCFLGCRVEVHVREGASLTMRRAASYPQSRGEHARIVWVDGSPEVRGLTASPSTGAIFGGWH
jgi:hypothetical protein